MQGVTIVELENVKEDDRGSIYQFENRDSEKLLLVKRRRGTVSGAHYHKGKSPLKDPETVVLIDGKAEIILRNGEEEYIQVHEKPVMFKLAPMVYHEIRALTDIVLIDMNSIDDDKDDTFKGMPE